MKKKTLLIVLVAILAVAIAGGVLWYCCDKKECSKIECTHGACKGDCEGDCKKNGECKCGGECKKADTTCAHGAGVCPNAATTPAEPTAVPAN